MSRDWTEPHEEEMLRLMKVSKLNKDFYNDLPSMVCVELDNHWITNFLQEDWFEKAWNEYRDHILNNTMDDMKMPAFVFKNYVKEINTSLSNQD
jgi:ADP-glucose pyrophosphorylase